MTATSTAPRAAPSWRRPALAIGAAFVVTLAGVGTALLMTRGGTEVPPITTVTTTLPVTTTAPATTTTSGTISVEAWSYPAADVPPFHATIAWDRNPESTWNLSYQGSTALVEVWYEAPRRFRFQLVELDTDLVAQGVPYAGQFLGGPGSYIVGDGEAWGQYEANNNLWHELDKDPGSRHTLSRMFWEEATSGGAPAGESGWAGECRDHVTSLTEEQVASRDTHHVVCSSVRGDWELWVDAETGLILKMLGETDVDDEQLGTSPEGGFEVTAIEFLEAPIAGSDTLFAVSAPEGAELPVLPDVSGVPPLHTVIAFESVPQDLGEEGPQPSSYTQEIWYQDPENWRFEILGVEGLAEFSPGEIHTLAGGIYSIFYPMTDSGYANAYWVGEEAAYGAPAEMLVTGELDTGWSEVGIATVAGRPTNHMSRHEVYEGGSSTADVWIDIETGLLLKRATEHTAGGEDLDRWTRTVLSIEIDPDFPEDIFTFTPEPGWCNLSDMSNCVRGMWDGTNLSQGEEVPTFTGSLADGTPFDLADLRGRPIVVFFWMDAFETGLLEQWLADFEALYQEWGNRVAFVSVPEMEQTDARRFVERVPLTHVVITCYGDFIDPEHPGDQLCFPSSPSDLWRVGWPTWVSMDAEGRAVSLMSGGRDYSYDALDAMIAAAVGG